MFSVSYVVFSIRRLKKEVSGSSHERNCNVAKGYMTTAWLRSQDTVCSMNSRGRSNDKNRPDGIYKHALGRRFPCNALNRIIMIDIVRF